MTSPPSRRAWPINETLYRYFQLCEAGMSVAALNPENPPRNRKEPRLPKLPGWIMELCNVGCALERIDPQLKDAVEARWKTHIKHQDAERDVMVLDAKMRLARRGGGDWRAVRCEKEEVEDRCHELWKKRRRLEQRKAYRQGMDALVIILRVEN